MNHGVKTILYPVQDMPRAKARFQALLGVAPIMDQPYYVGFQVGGQDIGLVPSGSNPGLTAFFHVDDLRKEVQALLEAGAQILEDVRDVGGGKLVASLRDPDGNILGLIQEA